jgi:phosphate transport system substrate-binding protein
MIFLIVVREIFWIFRILTPKRVTEDSDVPPYYADGAFKAIGCMAIIMAAETAAFVVGGFSANVPSVLMFHSSQTNPHLYAVGIFAGAYLGWKQARRRNLPRNAALRYIPPLIPIFWAILAVTLRNYEVGKVYYNNTHYKDNVLLLASVLYPCASFSISFALGCASLKRRSSSKWVLVLVMAVITGLASLPVMWAARDKSLTFDETYAGATVADYVDLGAYHPANDEGKLAKLDTPADFQIADNFPVVDGATAFYPIYSAILNETYNLADKTEFDKYLACSKTPEAYNRLIRGEADVIFVLQPSEGQINSAGSVRAEISLTPIAREGFVFFVNPNNPISDLSIEQIRDIYTRKITNWRQVGGPDVKILPFQRPDDSGSQTAMLKEVMKDRKITKPLREPQRNEYFPGMGGMVIGVGVAQYGVAQYRDAAESIGYSFRFFTQNMVTPYPYKIRNMETYKPADGAVKLLRINGVEPSEENIRSGAYPLTVEIYAATAGTKNPRVRELIDWILSPRGQELVERSGYVGVRPAAAYAPSP